MLSVIRQGQGSLCGLPDSCNCPIQNILEITEQSVDVIVDAVAERNFGYENEDIGMYLYSKSVSSSESCR